jgi:hypothetical protein
MVSNEPTLAMGVVQNNRQLISQKQDYDFVYKI